MKIIIKKKDEITIELKKEKGETLTYNPEKHKAMDYFFRGDNCYALNKKQAKS